MLEVARYICDMLGTLGLGQAQESWCTEFGRAFAELRMAERALTGVDAAQLEPASSIGGADPLVGVITRSLVDFRKAVREQALALNTSGDDTCNSSAQSTRSSLLELCDSVRAGVLADAGIVLADTPTAGPKAGEPTAPSKVLLEAQMQSQDNLLYSAFDDDGVPTHDIDGKELSKRARKKWQRKRDRRMRKQML
eukprot:g1727.t1